MKRTAALLFAALLCLLCFAGVVTAEEMITDGDFSDYSATSGFTYWTTTYSPPSTSQTSTCYANIVGVSGSGAYFTLSALSSDTSSFTSTASISQTVNLDNVDTLTFKTKKNTQSQLYPNVDIVLSIWKGTGQSGEYTKIGEYTFNNLGTDWTDQSVDLSQLSSAGSVELRFTSSVTSSGLYDQKMVSFYIKDVSATKSAPVFSSASLSPNTGIITTGSTVTATYAYTGSPSSTSKSKTYICWGDSETYYAYNGLSGSQTHTYNTAGTYSISMYAWNPVGTSETSTPLSVDVVQLSFDVYGSASGNTPFDAAFSFTASNNIQSLSWNFGDGTAASSSMTNPTPHRYTTQGVYTVTLTGSTSSGKSYTVTKTNCINTEAQYVRFGDGTVTSYNVGATVPIQWALRDADFTTHSYKVYVYPSTSDGTLTSQNYELYYSIPNDQTTSTTWSTNGLTGGYYSAYLLEDTTELTHTSPAVTMVALTSLTVNLAVSGESYYNSTKVTLFQNGVTIQEQTGITAGTVTFNSVPTGTYQVQAVTTGYSTQTATVLLTSGSNIITIDFVTGTSDGDTTGMGSQYAASYVTFRCYDSGTGKPLSGVTVNVVGVEATNPVEWMANLFGSAWGSKIIGTNLTGTSDSNGVVTFAMVPNVRYTITIKYGTYQAEKVFQPSTLTGEYPLELDITKWDSTNKFDSVVTSVTPTENSTIIASYQDNTGTTQTLNISLWTIEDNARAYLTSQVVTANTYNATFTPESPSGRSYIITFNSTTTKLGTITREYSVDFSGPRIKLGSLPDNFYIIISFLILCMVGAVGTIVTSKMYTLVVVIVAAFLWYAGWLFALGTVGSVVLLLCFVLAIIYYISAKSGGGE